MIGKSRWTAAGLLVVAFLLGLGVGFFAHGPILFGMRGAGMGERMKARLTHRFADELDLTPGQQVQVDRILEDSRRKMMTLRREVIHPQFKAIADSTRMQIEAILTPEQRIKFRAFNQRMKARRGRDRWLPWFGP